MMMCRLSIYLLVCFQIICLPKIFSDDDLLSRVILTPRGNQTQEESNKETIRKFYIELSKKNLLEAQGFLAENYGYTLINENFSGNYPETSGIFSTNSKSWWEAFPDLSYQIDSLIAEGNKVVARLEVMGNQEGPFLGIQPTGKRMKMNKIVIFTVHDGKILHISELWDLFEVMKQLGYIIL